jgi:hypothetical protein
MHDCVPILAIYNYLVARELAFFVVTLFSSSKAQNKVYTEGPLTSEALKFLSSRMSHYACWPPFSYPVNDIFWPINTLYWLAAPPSGQ